MHSDKELMKQLAGELANFEEIAKNLIPQPGDLPRLDGIDVYGGTMPLNASAPPVVGMLVVWMLSLSAMGMPCNAPRRRPCARSRSRASASSRACGFTVMTACSLFS